MRPWVPSTPAVERARDKASRNVGVPLAETGQRVRIGIIPPLQRRRYPLINMWVGDKSMQRVTKLITVVVIEISPQRTNGSDLHGLALG